MNGVSLKMEEEPGNGNPYFRLMPLNFWYNRYSLINKSFFQQSVGCRLRQWKIGEVPNEGQKLFWQLTWCLFPPSDFQSSSGYCHQNNVCQVIGMSVLQEAGLVYGWNFTNTNTKDIGLTQPIYWPILSRIGRYNIDSLTYRYWYISFVNIGINTSRYWYAIPAFYERNY